MLQFGSSSTLFPVSWSDTRIRTSTSHFENDANFISIGCESVVDADALDPLDVDSNCKLFREFLEEEIVHSCGKKGRSDL